MRKSTVNAYRFMVENKGKSVTPSELNKHLGVGNYASRHIWQLKNLLSCKIEVKKNGKTVVSYVLTDHPEKEPDEFIKVKKAGVVKVPVAKKVVAKKIPTEKGKKSFSAKPKDKPVVEQELPVTGSAVCSAVDPEFDSVDINDVMAAL
ncbi:MAG: hypothetical protein WD512_19540 [Candidatus Paceibacterota bacterium]